MSPNNQTEKAELEGFNMADFTITPSTQLPSVKPIIIQVPVKRPNKQKFFRVAEGDEYEVSVPVLELKEEGEYYLVRPEVLPFLLQEIKYVRLHLGYYLDGSPFLIPVTLPDADNPARWNSWHRSMAEVVLQAKAQWVRAVPDKGINGYRVMAAGGNFVCPSLPKDMTLSDYVRIGFRGRIIDAIEHPVVKQLLGL